ncbi:MAG TPA: thiamine pyrophosphate-dependent dehydrogenase E1 component subunit alpha [Bacillota bacterium]|nr:thiamine pyrophosphate-dependent dehydrogenase E1 component subunit alpha [Bacillota bacterium]
MADLSKEQLLQMYTMMFRIREFEAQVFELYKSGLMPGLAHLYIGQEAVAVGACSTLRENDYITSNHRGHGHLIARGADTRRMMAEILGKKTGYCKGKGGSMHIVAFDRGILGANGIVGAGIPIATGAGYMAKVKGTKQVTLSFFGDAASNQGTFHESLNMAGAWKLPVVYIVENNLYGISVNINRVTAVDDLSARAAAYGMPGVTVDGNDILAVYDAVANAVAFAREGGGPTLVECKTYRWRGHHVGDPAIEYRTREEETAWKQKCPIKRFGEKLAGEGIATKDELDGIEKSVVEEIKEAVEFAKESPYPAPEEAFIDVYF